MGGGEKTDHTPKPSRLVGPPSPFNQRAPPPISDPAGAEQVAVPPRPLPAPQVPRNQVSSRQTSGEDPAGEEGYFLVEAILRHKYNKGYLFLTKWQHFSVGEATWEPLKHFVQPDGTLNQIFREYVIRSTPSYCLPPITVREKPDGNTVRAG